MESIIGYFVYPVRGDRKRGWIVGNDILAHCYFTLLENMKIWCNVQVIINPLDVYIFMKMGIHISL